MSNYIKNLVKAQGWKEMEQIFEDTIISLKSEEIDESLSANEYKVVSIANKKAAEKLAKIIKTVKLKGSDIKQEFKSYK